MVKLPLLPAALLALSALARDDVAAEEELPPARLLTRNGEIVVGRLETDSLPIRTRYGPLEVPVADIRRLEFARIITPEDEERFARLVEEFESTEEGEERWEEIRSQLVREGEPAVKALGRGEETSTGKVREAFREILEEIEENASFRRGTDDIVVAKRFTIRGHLLLDEVLFETAYGTLRVRRKDVDRISFGNSPWGDLADRVLLIKTWTDTNQEYLHVRDSLDRLTRLRLVEFTGNTSSQLRKALRRHRVLVIPELEKQGNVAQVAAEASKALVRFVREGGVVISCGGSGNTSFLKSSKLLPCSSKSGRSDAVVRRKHPVVRGVPKAIPYANATFAITISSGRKMKVLAATDSGGIVVGVARLGAGAIVYCGWDFYESQDAHQKVLANAVRWAAGRIGGFNDI